MTTSQKVPRTRFGAVALGLAAVSFVLYPVVRPWTDESTVDGAVRAMSSDAWVAAHLFGMFGFILMALGLLAVRDAVRDTRGEPLAFAALVTSWIGVGLTLPYFGAEDFGLNAIALKSLEGQSFDLLALVETVRFRPVPATTFAVGLLTIAVGTTLAAVAIGRSGVLPRLSGSLCALGFLLFIPQFYLPPALRIGHGVLVAAGLGWLALALYRNPAAVTAEPAPLPTLVA